MTLQERFKTEIPERVLHRLYTLNEDYFIAKAELRTDYAAEMLTRIVESKDTIVEFGFKFEEVNTVDYMIIEMVLDSMREHKRCIFKEE